MLPVVDAMMAWGEQYEKAFRARLEAITLTDVNR